MTSFWRRLRLTLEMIKFEHSVFALPFALTGAIWRGVKVDSGPKVLDGGFSGSLSLWSRRAPPL